MDKIKRIAPWLALAASVAIADQVTKRAIVTALRFGEALRVTDFFNLILTYNPGAAFSFLAGAQGWQRGLFIAIAAIAVVVIVALLVRHQGERLFCAALALILGGAIGNVIDRAILGHVIDFLDFHAFGWHFWTFNLADSAITCGTALLLLDSFRGVQPKAKAVE